MRKLEIAFCIISFISIKWDLLFLLPGGSLLVILFLTLSSMFYFWFGFALFNEIRFRGILRKESYLDIHSNKILGGILTGWLMSITILGILFKIMSWTGATIVLASGIIGSIIILIIGFLKYQKSNSLFYPRVFKRVIIILIIAVALFVIPTEVMMRIKNRDNPAYAEALIKAGKEPDNLEAQKELEKQRNIAFPE
jgi:hypothetical protein